MKGGKLQLAGRHRRAYQTAALSTGGLAGVGKLQQDPHVRFRLRPSRGSLAAAVSQCFRLRQHLQRSAMLQQNSLQQSSTDTSTENKRQLASRQLMVAIT